MLRIGIIAAMFVISVEVLSHLLDSFFIPNLYHIVDHFTSSNIVVSFKLGSEQLGLLLSTVVTVVGVFLGLYFTALSAVAGNLFMRAPVNLQKLFMRNRKGRQYIETLVLTIIIGVYYLLLRSYGYDVGMVGPVLVTLLALYAVVRFMALGFQTFYFIQPGEAAATLISDARSAIDGASVGGFGWRRDYLQRYYQANAKAAMDSLKDLIEFGVDPIKFSEKQFVEIASYVGNLLNYYIYKRKAIPTNSSWFVEKFKHQKWLLANDSQLTISLNNGTSLQPTNIKDSLWFEDNCVEVIVRIFEYLVSKGQLEQAHATLEILVMTQDGVGANFYVDTAKSIVKKVTTFVDREVLSANESEDQNVKKGHLAIVDSFGRLPTAQLLGLLKYIDKKEWQDILKDIRSTKFISTKGVYKSKLPGSLLSNMETTHNQYRMEQTIEGKTISPSWYIETISVYQFLKFLVRYYDYLKALNTDLYEKEIDKLIERRKYIQAAHLTDCWVEYTNKLLSLGWKIQQLMDESMSLRKVNDLSWDNLDAELEKTILQGFNHKAIDKLTNLIPRLLSLPSSDDLDLPDYFGQAYTFGVEAAYQAARDNDSERLRSIFPSVFIGALAAYDSTKNDVEGWAQQSQLIFSSEPLEDIMTLSGYIKLYAELYENSTLWDICEVAWGTYLEGHNARPMIELLVSLANYRDSTFVIKPRDGLRLHWDTEFKAKMDDRALRVDEFSVGPFSTTPEPVAHSSALIRVVARQYGIMTIEARNIFFVIYLSKHESIVGLEINFPDRNDIERLINEETQISNDEVDEESDDEG